MNKKTRMKLNWIEIENFRGSKKFRAELCGENGIIKGANETGKTTLIDAYCFLFDDQDSLGSARFSILEIDNDGNIVEDSKSRVEAEFWIGSKLLRLKKIHLQKKTKKGKVTGNTTEYYIDDMDLKISRTQYLKRLSEKLPIKEIRSLIDVNFFCGRLPVEKRRAMLFELVGDMSDRDIILKMNDRDIILKIINNRSIAATKEFTKQKIKRLSIDIKNLKQQIKGATESMPDVKGLDKAELEKLVLNIDNEIINKREKLSADESGLSKSKLMLEISKIDNEIQAFRSNEGIETSAKIKYENDRIEYFENVANEKILLIEGLKRDEEKLTDEWYKIDEQKFVPTNNCFACGKPLDDDVITLQEAKFNDKKAKDIKTINEKGRALIDRIDREKDQLSNANKKIEECKENIDKYSKLIEIFKKEYSDKTKHLQDKKNLLEVKLNEIDRDSNQSTIQNEISRLEKNRDDCKSKLLDFLQIDKIEKRNEQRNDFLSKLNIEREEHERNLLIIEDLEIIKAEIIEREINKKFEITVWKLFKLNKDEETKQICEATYKGKNYSIDLNNGGKVNVGLDCIKTFQDYYNVNIPIMIDNSESVTKWLTTIEAQTIKLVADENIDKLTTYLNGEN